MGVADEENAEPDSPLEPNESASSKSETSDGTGSQESSALSESKVGAVSQESAGVTELFHRVNKLLPENQDLVVVSPDCPAAEALALMSAHNYSQVPVVSGQVVLGAFSYRSFARGVLETQGEKTHPLELPVDEFTEELTIVHITAELDSIFDALDSKGAVLVGEPDHLVGILTGVDALRYLHDLAEQFVQLQEIEQAIRAVISRAVTPEQLKDCIQRSLGSLYTNREEQMPKLLVEMSFAEYVSVIGDGRNWPQFQPILGSERSRVRARLERIADLRNDVFHFKRELSSDDRSQLVASRNWLLRKLQLADQGVTGD